MNFFKVIFIIYLIILTVIRIYFKSKYYKLISKDFIKFEPFYIVITRMVFGILLLILLFFMLFREKAINFSYVNLPFSVKIAGIIFSTFGLFLLIWAHTTLKDNFTTTIFLKEHHKLVTNGPYKFIRHPMYVAYIIYFTGLALVSANYIFFILANSIIFSLMILRLPYEEKMLSERFFEYREYSSKVPRFVPWIWKQ